MKRDMDLIRTILLHISNCEEATVQEVKLDQFNSAQVAYHVNLLAEAGYITGTSMQTLQSDVPEWVEVRLTWDGYEFIDAARNETVWTKFKKTVAEKGGAIPFSIATDLLTAIAKQEFGLP